MRALRSTSAAALLLAAQSTIVANAGPAVPADPLVIPYTTRLSNIEVQAGQTLRYVVDYRQQLERFRPYNRNRMLNISPIRTQGLLEVTFRDPGTGEILCRRQLVDGESTTCFREEERDGPTRLEVSLTASRGAAELPFIAHGSTNEDDLSVILPRSGVPILANAERAHLHRAYALITLDRAGPLDIRTWGGKGRLQVDVHGPDDHDDRCSDTGDLWRHCHLANAAAGNYLIVLTGDIAKTNLIARWPHAAQ